MALIRLKWRGLDVVADSSRDEEAAVLAWIEVGLGDVAG